MNYARKAVLTFVSRRGFKTKHHTSTIITGTPRKKRIYFYVTAGVLGNWNEY